MLTLYQHINMSHGYITSEGVNSTLQQIAINRKIGKTHLTVCVLNDSTGLTMRKLLRSHEAAMNNQPNDGKKTIHHCVRPQVWLHM